MLRCFPVQDFSNVAVSESSEYDKRLRAIWHFIVFPVYHYPPPPPPPLFMLSEVITCDRRPDIHCENDIMHCLGRGATSETCCLAHLFHKEIELSSELPQLAQSSKEKQRDYCMTWMMTVFWTRSGCNLALFLQEDKIVRLLYTWRKQKFVEPQQLYGGRRKRKLPGSLSFSACLMSLQVYYHQYLKN